MDDDRNVSKESEERALLEELRSLADFRKQARNTNKHTERGMDALRYSVSADGWTGALTAAADGEIFDGSARLEIAQAGVQHDPLVVRTDGSRPVVVIREDIPTADHPRALRLGVAANRVAELNLQYNPTLLAEYKERGLDLDPYFEADEWPALPDVDGGAEDESPFGDFGDVSSDDRFVSFRFGDYSGQVSRDVYDSFVKAYQEQRSATSVRSVRWKLSSAWASKRLDCTIAGITSRCHANCCRSMSFWPPRAGENPKQCDFLGERGCTLAPEDKPVICHLFPLVLNKSATLVAWNRMPQPGSCCKPNYGQGPMIVDALRANLVHLFGEATAAYIQEEVHAGRDPEFDVPVHIAAALEWEEAWAARDELPEMRSARWARYQEEHADELDAETSGAPASRVATLDDVLRSWLAIGAKEEL